MFDASEYREIVSGRRRGLFASLIRGGLQIPAVGYAAVIYCRNRFFDWSVFWAHRVAVPVISVGNVTAGGTGKSPFVFWLAQALQTQGLSPAVLSRGYGAAPAQPNDEALELRQRAPELSHLQGADRVASARRAIAEFAAQVLILDDGFQHRRLARDLDIVLIDAIEPFGYGQLLPRGLLREPLSSLRRAGAIILTRADQVPARERNRIHQVIQRCAPDAAWAEASFTPTDLVDDCNADHPLSDLRKARVFGFAAIGHPENFRRTLQSISGELTGFLSFPDHHHYSPADIRALIRAAIDTSADFLVCTCKDLVKLPANALDPVPLRAVRINTEITSGLAELQRRIFGAVGRTKPD